MSAVLDQLIVEINADVKGLQSKLSSVSGQIEKFGHNASSDIGNVNKAFAAARLEALKYIAVWKAFDIGKGVINAGLEMQALQNRMAAATGDVRVAGEAMEYVRGEAERLGLDFRATAGGFASFSASALRAGLTLQETQEVFTGVSEAAAAMHLSTERVQYVFTALSQMASKGQVSMEELRQQLGESLPGAIQIFAKAMGVSNAEFLKMVANGQVTVADLRKLGNELSKQYGEVAVKAAESAQGAFAKLGNAWFDLQVKMSDVGMLDGVTDAVHRMTEALNDPATAQGLHDLAVLIGAVAEVAGEATAALLKLASIPGTLFGGRVPGAPDPIASYGELKTLAGRSGPADTAATSPYKGNSTLDAMLAQANGEYTLGQPSVPGVSPSQQKAIKKAQEEAAQLRQQLQEQTDKIRYDFGTPTEQENIDYDAQLDKLREALDARLLTEDEYRGLSEKAEAEHQERLRQIAVDGGEEALRTAQEIARMRVNLQKSVGDNLIGLMQTFAGKNKAISMALIAVEKARAIASILIAGQEAGMKAAAWAATFGGPPAAAAAYSAMVNLSYVSAGLVAAQGLAEIAMSGKSGGGGSSASTSGGSFTTSGPITATSAVQPKTVYINLQGDDASFFSKNSVRKLIDQLNDASLDGSVLKVQAA